jgi:hypothetical protein
MRGRVSAVNLMFVGSSNELGLLGLRQTNGNGNCSSEVWRYRSINGDNLTYFLEKLDLTKDLEEHENQSKFQVVLFVNNLNIIFVLTILTMQEMKQIYFNNACFFLLRRERSTNR